MTPPSQQLTHTDLYFLGRATPEENPTLTQCKVAVHRRARSKKIECFVAAIAITILIAIARSTA